MPINSILSTVTPADVSATDVQYFSLDENILAGPILVIFVAMFIPIVACFFIDRGVKTGIYPFVAGGITATVLYILQQAAFLLVSLLIPTATVPTAVNIIVTLLLECAVVYGTYWSMRLFRKHYPQTGHGVSFMLGYSFIELTMQVVLPAMVTVMATYSLLSKVQSGGQFTEDEMLAVMGVGSLSLSNYLASCVNCIIWMIAKAGVGVMLWLPATREDADKSLLAAIGCGAAVSVPSIINRLVGINDWLSVGLFALITVGIWFAAVRIQGAYIDNPLRAPLKKRAKK